MQINWLGMILFIPATMSGLLALYALHRRRTPGAIPLAFLMLTLMLWSAAYALELFSRDLNLILFLGAVEYACISLAPILWLLLVLDFIGRHPWLTRRRLLALLGIPLVTQILYLTNDYHHWFHASRDLVNINNITILKLTYGPWHHVFVAYAYLLLAIGILLLIRHLRHTPPIVQHQTLTLLGGTIVPFVVNVVYLLGGRPFGVLDSTPFAFTISGLVVTWGILRFRLLDLKPLARETLIEKLRDGILVLDENQRIVDLNPAAAKLLGVETNATIGQAISAVLDGIQITAPSPGEIETQQEIQRAATTLQIRILPLLNSLQQPIGRLVTLYDVTDQRRNEEALRESEEKYRLLVEHSYDTIYTLTADGIFTFVSPAWTRQLGHPIDQVVGKSFKQFVHPDDIPKCIEFIQTVIRTGHRQTGIEYRIQHMNGTWYWHISNAVPLKDASRTTIGLYGIAHDITDRKRLEAELQQQASTDELTGVFNRRHFLKLAQEELKRAIRLKHPLTIALIDIDHFKHINDTYGHAAGDQALLAFTKICKKNIREIDVFARFGGDEFALLLPEANCEQAREALERIRLLLTELQIPVNDHSISITLSAGISSLASEHESLDTLLGRTDQALYQAKQAGRNRIQVDPSRCNKNQGRVV